MKTDENRQSESWSYEVSSAVFALAAVLTS